MTRKITLIAVVASLIIFWNCREWVEAENTHMADYAWELYATKDYENSYIWFVESAFEDSVYKDTYNGLGWTYGKLGDISSSISHFEFGLSLVLTDTTDADINLMGNGHNVGQQIYAGLTMAYHARGDSANYVKAVNCGNTLLNMTGDSAYATSQVASPWQFSRDTDVNSRHIIWTLSSSYFALSQFDESLTKVQQLMSDPTSFSPDVTTVEGRRDLAEKLETLRGTL